MYVHPEFSLSISLFELILKNKWSLKPLISHFALHFLCPKQVGFEMIDAFAKSQGISMDTVHCKALFGKGISTFFNLTSLHNPCNCALKIYFLLCKVLLFFGIHLRFCWRCSCFPCKAPNLYEFEWWICKLSIHLFKISWSLKF